MEASPWRAALLSVNSGSNCRPAGAKSKSPLFNVQFKDRDCPSARCAAVSAAIRRNIQWLLPSKEIFNGYCRQKEYSVAAAIRRNIQWLLPSEGIFSGYCHQKEYSMTTAVRGNIQWLLPSEGIFSGYCHQKEYSVATAIWGNIQWKLCSFN